MNKKRISQNQVIFCGFVQSKKIQINEYITAFHQNIGSNANIMCMIILDRK